jgi:hypothetical protein
MTIQTKEEIIKLLIVAGYEKELSDILFIEDIEPIEFELIDFDNYEIEPIEFDELY